MRRWLTALVPALLLLAGCATPRIPQVDPVAGTTLPPEYFAGARPDVGLDDAWWHGFADPELDRLIVAAFTGNPSLEAARQRLAAARAIVVAEGSDFFPTIDGDFSGDVGVDERGSGRDGAAASLGGVWRIDINGRLSAERAAAVAAADGAAQLVADQRRLLAAAVASQYIELKRTAARLRLLEESSDLQRQTLRIVTLRFEAGLSSNLDVRRARADVARTEAQRGLLLLARARSANALAVLVGETPSGVPEASREVEVPRYASGPEIGVPADLLRRRPDLLLAEAAIAGAAANVGIERADLLPALALPGFVTLGDGSVDGLFSQALANLSAVLGVPLVDGGRRRAEVRAAERNLAAELADYRQALLGVLAEVETALTAISAAQDRTGEFQNAVTESEAAFEQSNALYREGLASLFDVLDVQRQLISSREALIDGNADLAQAHVDLFTAVGGDMQG
ncbi:TolC family protein [Erythrobacter sanguineus]|uniref:Efflux transporter, outer membrane factor (OMF) lipoprotein, NodT family n=1 Tax=Erythrobacter sanguineus TaxID=198312 RepID=A0A1M7SC81_9SPHN|nr:TolC family protein [Erythrobacter sanguineus]SHN56117.1 efflux transporter, outer membrane factor (OMF) lipoprotein, NodT family [Erythrobacter sanguineus]